MFRKIKSSIKFSEIPTLENFNDNQSELLNISLKKGPFGYLVPLVNVGDSVKKNTLLAEDEKLSLYSSKAGVIEKINKSFISIKIINDSNNIGIKKKFNRDDLSSFISKSGIIGMGGSGFPTAFKFKSALGKVKKLVINATECEPGVTIDRALLLSESEKIIEGANALAKTYGANEIILSILKDKIFKEKFKSIYKNFTVVEVGSGYPSGAERLIIKALTKKDLPQGVFPFELGFYIQNVASLWALGGTLKNDAPLTIRPLSFNYPAKKIFKNIMVPNGTLYKDILNNYGLDDEKDIILVAGGLMMGKEVNLNDSVSLNTTSLWVLSNKEGYKDYRDCIRCGACYDVCPLKLHPSMVFNLWQNEKSYKQAFITQVNDCFLCGSCASVCPSYIPLVDAFREAKQWLRK